MPQPEYTRWFSDNGDATHRLNYDLDKQSVVVDLGGYHGQWTANIVLKYRPKVVHLFEPIPAMMAVCRSRLASLPEVVLHPFAVGDKDGQCSIVVDNDSSSIAGGGHGSSIQIDTVSVDTFLNLIPGTVHLIKINIEGYEYPLLERLLDAGAISRFRDIQVQFHVFVPNAEERRKAIQERLLLTHNMTYNYNFVWENWRLR